MSDDRHSWHQSTPASCVGTVAFAPPPHRSEGPYGPTLYTQCQHDSTNVIQLMDKRLHGMSEWVAEYGPNQHIIGHFREKTLQANDCTGTCTHNQKQSNQLDSLRWYFQRRSATPHFWGARPGGYDAQIRTRPRFLYNAPTPKFHHPMFTCSEVTVLTNKQTNKQTNRRRWKHLTLFAMLRHWVNTTHTPEMQKKNK